MNFFRDTTPLRILRLSCSPRSNGQIEKHNRLLALILYVWTLVTVCLFFLFVLKLDGSKIGKAHYSDGIY